MKTIPVPTPGRYLASSPAGDYVVIIYRLHGEPMVLRPGGLSVPFALWWQPDITLTPAETERDASEFEQWPLEKAAPLTSTSR